MSKERSRYEFLRKVMDLVETFEDQHSQPDIASFTLWLNAQVFPPNIPQADGKPLFTEGTLESNIARIVGNLYKFTKQYTKKALQQSPILTLDDFGFLAYVYFRPAMTKSELIKVNLMEISSGTEVIKRLIKSGLAEEFPDEKDSRAKSLRITTEGREVMRAVFREMGKVAQIVAGNLAHEERIQLLSLLTKLDNFHHQLRHHPEAKTQELDALLAMLPKGTL
jgi:DNA-binding MarR family transcriptional regulator